MAVIGREDMDGHIKAHPVCRTRRTATVNTADRNSGGEVYDVDASRLERIFRQIPVGNQADLAEIQSRSERHALAPNVAANRQQSGQGIATPDNRISARRKKMAKEIRPVIDVNENVGQVGPWKSRLDQFFESLDGVRLFRCFQGRQMELTLFWIDGERLVGWNPPIHVVRHSLQALV